MSEPSAHPNVPAALGPAIRATSNSTGLFWAAGLLGMAVVAMVVGAVWGWLTSTTTEIFGLAALAIVALLLLFEVIAQRTGASFVASVLLGTDQRTSTSKTFVLMWTLLVAWALVAYLIAGEFLQQRDCVATHDCSGDAIGFLQLGWQSLLKNGLDGAYLVLLGIPAGAAVAAKAVTQSKVDSGSAPTMPITDQDRSLAARVSQIFSADDGSTDVADLQYLVFNLVLAVYFVAQIVHLTGVGLPQLPSTLLGLTSVSAALYVGKKVATNTQPTIAAVFPSFLNAGDRITIVGNGLTGDPAVPASQRPTNLEPPQVTINGVAADNIQADPNVADRIEATVPGGLNKTAQDTISGSVEVLSVFGFKTPPYAVTIKREPQP